MNNAERIATLPPVCVTVDHERETAAAPRADRTAPQQPTLLTRLLPDWDEDGRPFASLRALVESRENRVVSDAEFNLALADYLTDSGAMSASMLYVMVAQYATEDQFPGRPVRFTAFRRNGNYAEGILATVVYETFNPVLGHEVEFELRLTHNGITASVWRGASEPEFEVNLADPTPIVPNGYEPTVDDIRSIVAAIYTSDLWTKIKVLSARYRMVL